MNHTNHKVAPQATQMLSGGSHTKSHKTGCAGQYSLGGFRKLWLTRINLEDPECPNPWVPECKLIQVLTILLYLNLVICSSLFNCAELSICKRPSIYTPFMPGRCCVRKYIGSKPWCRKKCQTLPRRRGASRGVQHSVRPWPHAVPKQD